LILLFLLVSNEIGVKKNEIQIKIVC